MISLVKRAKIQILFFIILSIIFSFSTPAFAWKLKTHAYIANIVMDDARDGKVWIPPYGEFEVRPEVAEAIKLCPNYFRGGSIGPDGFPDFWTGQTYIHPNTNPYLVLLWNNLPAYNATALPTPPGVKVGYMASDNPKRQAWAFTFGYFSHAAGDMWAHDWVNTYAGKAFPGLAEIKANPTNNLQVIAKHMAVENTLDKRITLSSSAIDIPNDFVLNTLILNQTAVSYGMNPVISKFARLYFEKLPHKDEIDYGTVSQTGINVGSGMTAPHKTRDAYWYDDLSNGFKSTSSQTPGWMEANKRAIKDVMELNKGMIGSLGDYLGMWSLTYFFDMLGWPSVTRYLGENVASNRAQIEAALDAIGLTPEERAEITDDVTNALLKLTLGMDKTSFNQVWSAEVTQQLFPQATFNEIMSDIGNPPSEATWRDAWNNQAKFNDLLASINGPLYNSVITTKIMMLKPSELQRLLGGKKLSGLTGEVAILGLLKGIDFSKQFAAGEGLAGDWLGYGMTLSQIQNANWRPIFPIVFKPYGPRDTSKKEVWSSSLDANHRWAGIYPVTTQMLVKPPTISNAKISQFNSETIEVVFSVDRQISSAALEYYTPSSQLKTTSWIPDRDLHANTGTAYGISIHQINLPAGLYKIKIKVLDQNGTETQTALHDFVLFGSSIDWNFTATHGANNTYVLTWNKYPRSEEFQKYVLEKGDQIPSATTTVRATSYDADQIRPQQQAANQPIEITNINTITKTIPAAKISGLTLTARSKRGNFLTKPIAPTIIQAQATATQATTATSTTQSSTTTTGTQTNPARTTTGGGRIRYQ
ncbi:MAG TPA: zinc dependent phospholipase C family protein [Candidatus Omnitrophota bacterium]|nr:zinc dependent phospholipase C family protein [Candidatus Omnitrophota bacterium]